MPYPWTLIDFFVTLLFLDSRESWIEMLMKNHVTYSRTTSFKVKNDKFHRDDDVVTYYKSLILKKRQKINYFPRFFIHFYETNVKLLCYVIYNSNKKVSHHKQQVIYFKILRLLCTLPVFSRFMSHILTLTKRLYMRLFCYSGRNNSPTTLWKESYVHVKSIMRRLRLFIVFTSYFCGWTCVVEQWSVSHYRFLSRKWSTRDPNHT